MIEKYICFGGFFVCKRFTCCYLHMLWGANSWGSDKASQAVVLALTVTLKFMAKCILSDKWISCVHFVSCELQISLWETFDEDTLKEMLSTWINKKKICVCIYIYKNVPTQTKDTWSHSQYSVVYHEWSINLMPPVAREQLWDTFHWRISIMQYAGYFAGFCCGKKRGNQYHIYSIITFHLSVSISTL